MWKILRRASPRGSRFKTRIRVATGPRFADTLSIKGACRVGATGPWVRWIALRRNPAVAGRTQNLVVWLFDHRAAWNARRRDHQTLRSDLRRVGRDRASGNPAFKKHDSKRCSARGGVRSKHLVLDPKPTTSGGNQSAVSGMKTDESGIERTFQAVFESAERHRQFRTQEPRRT